MTVVARLKDARILAILRMDGGGGSLMETAVALHGSGVRAREELLAR